MYIQKVKLQNFRSFGDEGICFLFNKGINAVIGENNNGKTALIDAIRIAFSCVLYKKDIFFSKTDFHVNAAGERAAFAQIDVYLKDVPQNLIEIWDPIQPDCGEFHVVFTLEKTAAGTDKVKYRAWGGKCEGNLLSSDTLEAINLDYLSALRDASSEMKPSRNSKLAELLETIAKEPKDKEALVDKLRTANALALEPNNIEYLLDAISTVYPEAGPKLRKKVNAEASQQLKALMIWLFVRSRNSAKAQVAQALGRILQKQHQDDKNGVTSPFVVPKYIKDAIYNVTRRLSGAEE